MLAEAMGAGRDSTPGEPGHIAAPAISSLDEVDKLRPVDPERDGRIPVLLEAIRIMAAAVGGRVAIRGNCDQCAFSLAGLLRGMEDFMMDLRFRARPSRAATLAGGELPEPLWPRTGRSSGPAPISRRWATVPPVPTSCPRRSFGGSPGRTRNGWSESWRPTGSSP